MENKGFLFIIISMFGLGIANIFYKKSNMELGATHTTFFYYLFAFTISLIVWLISKDKGNVDARKLVYPAFIAVFLYTSVFYFNLSLKDLKIGTASIFRSLSFIVTIILSVFIFKDKLLLKDWIGIMFAIISILLLK